MTSLEHRLAVPLPKRMHTLARDARGYPIPFIVLTDRKGNPQFTINHGDRLHDCRSKRLCSICGKRIDGLFWFVGGSRCFVHEHGAFVDPPMHRECGSYALQVCPFLAAPGYLKRIDDAKLPENGLPEGMALLRTEGMPSAQPERFGFGGAISYRTINPRPGETLSVVDRWTYVEWWRFGEQVNAPDAALMRELTA
jgi:hypothetical protein